jgi:hypothetical protein
MKAYKILGRIAICCLFTGCCSIVFGQTTPNQKELNEGLETLIKYFKDDEEQQRISGMRKIPGAYKSIEISDNPIALKINEIVLENPYGDDFPISYTVIYKDRIISLFQSGHFACHSLETMQRDLSFEEKINSKKFDYHWLIDNQLVGLSQEKYYYLNSDDKWIDYKENIPLWNQPKLFEDDNYIAFCDWGGEFGGTVYFFNKITGKIFFTEATDANTIYKENDKYYILYELGHMTTIRSTLKEISNPDLLTPISLEDLRKFHRDKKFYGIGDSDKSNASKIVFKLEPITFHSSFMYKGRRLYITDNLRRTFLAEKENGSIKIVNPLFNNDIIMHYTVTTSYPNAILINRAWYMVGHNREISFFIIKDDEFIKIDWNKKH